MSKPSAMGRFIFVLAIISTLLTLYVNTMGFVDADTGSAFGCGHQWFTCNGQIIPTLNGLHVLIEFSHRMGVPVLTLFLFATAILAAIRYRKWIELPILAALSVLFVLLEAVLGGIAVIWEEPPAVIATHFGVSLLAFCWIILLTIYVVGAEKALQSHIQTGQYKPLRRPLKQPAYRILAWLAIPYIYIAMYVGAYISSADLGPKFSGFPFPNEHVIHVLAFDWLHRTLAGILVMWVVALYVWAYRMRGERRDLLRGSTFSLVFVILQAFSGVYMVYTHVSLVAFLIHVTIVTGLFASLGYIAVQTLPPSISRKNRAYAYASMQAHEKF